MIKALPLFLIAFLIGQPSYSKKFRNTYIEFELPDRWECELKDSAHLCRHRISKACQQDPTSKACQTEIKRSREALIVMAAKEKSAIDSMTAFKKHFGEPKKFNAAAGSTQSKIVHNKEVGIQKQLWLDSMHLGSELPHYYTRYLSTIQGNIAVLVSFTSHKKYYTNYSDQFFKGIKSLKVTNSNLSRINKKELGNKVLSHPIDLPDIIMQPDPQPESDGLSTLLFGLSMLLAGTGVFIWYRTKKPLDFFFNCEKKPFRGDK